MVTDVRLKHPINVPSSIAVIFFGRTINAKGSYTKAFFPNIFTITACLFMDLAKFATTFNLPVALILCISLAYIAFHLLSVLEQFQQNLNGDISQQHRAMN